MGSPIVFDGLRIFLGDLTLTPRGIDRIDVGYARFLFENWSGDCFGLLPTPWGIRLYDRDKGLRLLDSVQALWRENQPSGTDAAFQRFCFFLGHHIDNDAGVDRAGVDRMGHNTGGAQRRGLASLGLRSLKNNPLSWGQPAHRDAPKGSVYLNVGQLGWAAPVMTRWLRRRADVRAIFMLHDVIPLQRPDLVSRSGRIAYECMLNTVIRHAAGLITTTEVASRAVCRTLRAQGLPPVPVQSLHLPVDPVFLEREPRSNTLSQTPYFVICGAIETRKNHALLLDVWRRMVQRVGPTAPRLMIIGSPAHGGDQVLKQLHETATLRDHVVVLSGMSSPSLRRVIANATAVLMPSFAEGFGLPVAEALALGTPVIASDLPALREVGRDLAVYLDPTDPVAWFEAILDAAESDAATEAWRARVAAYSPLTRTDYFSKVEAFLQSFN